MHGNQALEFPQLPVWQEAGNFSICNVVIEWNGTIDQIPADFHSFFKFDSLTVCFTHLFTSESVNYLTFVFSCSVPQLYSLGVTQYICSCTLTNAFHRAKVLCV